VADLGFWKGGAIIAKMEPVRIFDDRYRYRSKPVRLDSTGRSEIQTGTGPASNRYRFHLWIIGKNTFRDAFEVV
jgi:hypothetical protein